MKRRSFLRNMVLGITGTLLCPKDIFSTPTSEEKNILVKVDVKSNNDSNNEIPNDLVKFAKEFSENYKGLSDNGTYVSNCGKYRIDYFYQLKDVLSGQILNTPYRVGHATGIMEFSKSKIADMPKSIVFNAVVWCYIMYKEPRDYTNADIKSTQCSLDNGFSKKELFIHYCKMLKGSPSELNTKRVRKLYSSINKHKPN
jgi:hypothetical protein